MSDEPLPLDEENRVLADMMSLMSAYQACVQELEAVLAIERNSAKRALKLMDIVASTTKALGEELIAVQSELREVKRIAEWRSIKDLDDRVAAIEAEDTSWMGIESAKSHYVASLANWTIALDERDEMVGHVRLGIEAIRELMAPIHEDRMFASNALATLLKACPDKDEK
jgi:hypothetical protein